MQIVVHKRSDQPFSLAFLGIPFVIAVNPNQDALSARGSLPDGLWVTDIYSRRQLDLMKNDSQILLTNEMDNGASRACDCPEFVEAVGMASTKRFMRSLTTVYTSLRPGTDQIKQRSDNI